jgi:hypothetical protein
MQNATNPHLPPTLRYGAASNPLPQPEGEEAQNQVDRAVPCSMPILAAKPQFGLTSSAERPIHLAVRRIKSALGSTLLPVAALCASLASCETTNYVPPVTPQMAAASPRKQDVDLKTLHQGRTLFVHRCIECHTLPAIWKYSREDWPEIVNDMSHRASLKPAERDAVIAYILAVRARER